MDRGATKPFEGGDVVIDYTSWRGIRRLRRIRPRSIVWGKNEWHPEMQYLMAATDLETGELRIFAMKDIHSWHPADAPAEP